MNHCKNKSFIAPGDFPSLSLCCALENFVVCVCVGWSVSFFLCVCVSALCVCVCVWKGIVFQPITTDHFLILYS